MIIHILSEDNYHENGEVLSVYFGLTDEQALDILLAAPAERDYDWHTDGFSMLTWDCEIQRPTHKWLLERPDPPRLPQLHEWLCDHTGHNYVASKDLPDCTWKRRDYRKSP